MKTASRIVGTSSFMEGFFAQDFPIYGAERRGAPIMAFTRLSDNPILERGIITNPDINIIADEQGKDDAWKELPADFLDAVRFCAFSASTDKTLGMLTCVWVEGKDVLSFDRYRASWYQMETEAPNDFYLEAAHIAKLCNFDPPVEYCITKAWAHFQIPNGAVVSILLTIPDKLLDLRKKFNDFKPITKIDLPESLSEAVEAASLAVELLEKPDQKVLIRFESDTIFCAGSSERGKIEKEIHLEEPLDINPFSIKTSPKSMIEVLDKAAHLLVGKHAGMFKSTEKAGYQHLIGLNMEK